MGGAEQLRSFLCVDADACVAALRGSSELPPLLLMLGGAFFMIFVGKLADDDQVRYGDSKKCLHWINWGRGAVRSHGR